jgi:hypothetical protein
MKKIPFTLEEHESLANDLLKAQKLLEPWMDKFYTAYSVNGNECKDLHNVLKLLSNKICDHQDKAWYALKNNGHKSPYYGLGKTGWI